MCITRIALALVLSMSLLMPPARHQVQLVDARPARLIAFRRRGGDVTVTPRSVSVHGSAAAWR